MPQSDQSSLVVLAGKSGSGKTELLQSLQRQGFPVINLENFAQHSGSAFGKLTDPDNTITSSGLHDYLLDRAALHEPVVFTECKASTLSNITIPSWFINSMKQGFIIHIDTPFEQRLERLTNRYTNVSVENFSEALNKLKGKIKEDIYTAVHEAILKNDYRLAIESLLLYYDNSNEYNYYIDHAAVTIHTDELDEQSIIEQITNVVLENHSLFFQGS